MLNFAKFCYDVYASGSNKVGKLVVTYIVTEIHSLTKFDLNKKAGLSTQGPVVFLNILKDYIQAVAGWTCDKPICEVGLCIIISFFCLCA